MRVGIDLDGVAYPFAEEFRAYCSTVLGSDLPPYTHWNSHQKHWGLSHEQMTQLMGDALDAGKLWRYGQPEQGFVEATWKLMDMGHTVVIATDRLQGTKYKKLAQATTRAWLGDARVNYDELLFTSDKRDAHAGVFIDDRPQAIPLLLLDGTNAVYYDRPWNAGFPYPRVKSWDEFVEYVADVEGSNGVFTR